MIDPNTDIITIHLLLKRMALKGDELLSVLRQNQEAPKETLLELTGYTTEKDGRKSYGYTAFYQAVIEAQGLVIPAIKAPSKGAGKRGGRELPWETKCQSNGQILLGSGYLREAGLEPGAEFKVETTDGTIKLTLKETK